MNSGNRKNPIIAWHLVLCMYGFWLPNDPRGSWSKYVAADAIYAAAGPATFARHRRSVAAYPHDHALRVAAKAALKFPPVVLAGIQARAVSRGFAQARREAGYDIYACAIMPDHVHLVLGVPPRGVGVVLAHFKSQATRRLNDEGLLPQPPTTHSKDRPPVWAEGKWCGFLNRSELPGAIRYVENNPVQAGLPRQFWSFVTPPPPDIFS